MGTVEGSTSAGPTGLVVLFDRDCGLCQATVRQLRRWDRRERLSFVALQDAAGSGTPALELAAARLPLGDALHVVDESGRIRAGGDAALEIVDRLPGGWLLRPWRRVEPFRALIRYGYGKVAAHRHDIGRGLGLEGAACEVPVRLAS
jgi:predicted DCC family thiol-disulfide oxidoreductase YuxK